MTKMKLIVMAGAVAMGLTMCAGTAAFAQSQPNCGPNAPAGDTYGVPTSGSAQARAGARLCEQMNARPGASLAKAQRILLSALSANPLRHHRA